MLTKMVLRALPKWEEKLQDYFTCPKSPKKEGMHFCFDTTELLPRTVALAAASDRVIVSTLDAVHDIENAVTRG